MPKGRHEYAHNDSRKSHINFLGFKEKKPNLGKKGS